MIICQYRNSSLLFVYFLIVLAINIDIFMNRKIKIYKYTHIIFLLEI